MRLELVNHGLQQSLAESKRLEVQLAEVDRQIAELVWRTTQCAAFNWHNELLELDLEPEVRPWTSR